MKTHRGAQPLTALLVCGAAIACGSNEETTNLPKPSGGSQQGTAAQPSPGGQTASGSTSGGTRVSGSATGSSEPVGGASSASTASSSGGQTEPDEQNGTGEQTATGGQTATESGSKTGGRSARGGTSSTNRTSSSGGVSGKSGSNSEEGAQVSGGKSASGGRIASGGRAATGGRESSAGGSAAGGPSESGSSGGSSAGGASSSPGCGSSNTSPCSKSGTTCSLDVNGTARSYYVQLPSSYNSSKPYPVIFQFHPRGGSAEMALNMYRLSAGLPDAIYVTPQGLSANGTTGWANSNGEDIAFTKAMVADVQAKYCVDNARIFSTGFSYGGMMSFAVGCEMGDVFRAIAPMSGALYSDFNCKGTGHAIAMWGSHGTSDGVVPIADGRAALNKILQQNHCGTTTSPIEPSPCVAYQGCDEGYPVTWCEFDGDHGMPNFASNAIVAFFKQF